MVYNTLSSSKIQMFGDSLSSEKNIPYKSIKVSLKPIENVILMMKDCLLTGIRESKIQFPEFLILP